ncbi:Ribonuclease H-like superfamily [Arabidopsis thaliana x Arabidopsis arenosa]|uniref:Ribonuclease H-like superfamily n=1 Tax=Arabidopsis thaliana x Arabidopsis arenosa TaxID=1240361 RepID=A0A8T1ZJ52_9BRAS|nr:Ribonuclease H-like superfamily [Arabidopsis thaliana x Arabidopsis arenosa]
MENTKIRAPVTLKGGNYLLWARTMKTILCGRGFWPHIIKSEAPRETTTNEEGLEIVLVDEDKWFQEDQMVLSVLQNSLEASILEGYSYCETPKDLWETLQNVFGNQSNLSRVFEIKKAINELTQGDMEFTQHFGKFRSLWAELEMLRPNTLDPAVINERREQDKVFGLLFTLNPGYNDLIKHLLRADKLQNLEEVCSQIQKEQGSLGLFGSKGELVSGNSSELASANRGNFNTNRGKAPWCDHCKKSGHAKEKCWILHPHLRPARREPRANHATGENLGGQEQAGTSSQALGGNGAAMMASSDLVRRSDLDALIKALKESSGNAYHALSSLKPLIVDSGASHHMISDSKLMKNIEPALGNVIIANGDKIPVKGLGDLELFSKKSKAFYMPTFTSNLLSVKRATTDLNCYAIFGPNDVHFQDIETSRVLGHGGTKDGLYVLEDTKLSTPLASHFSSVLVNANNAIWHARLGHPHSRALGLLLPSISFKNDECEACILGKHCKSVFPKSNTIYENCFDLVHSDVWTSPCLSRENQKYFVTFIDEKSKYTWLTLLPSKDRVLEAFTNFQNYVTNHYNAKIKIFRSDNGGEYTSHAFKQHLAKHGIIHQTSCPYTPQQNGVAERKNRHLMEVARSMMFHTNVPKRFWSDAVVLACYLINRIPTKILQDSSPFEVLNKNKPSINHLRVFGCVCFVLIGEQRSKLDPKSVKGMFIGYSITQKGYKCYIPETKKVLVSRDVKFVESKGYYEDKNWEDIQDLTHSPSDRANNLCIILERLGVSNSQGHTNSPNPNPEPTQQQETSQHEEEEHLQEEENIQANIQENILEEGEIPSDHEEETTLSEEENLSTPDHNEGSTSQEAPIALRRSERLKFPPSNWKNTRVYYNSQAVAHPIQAVYPTSSMERRYSSRKTSYGTQSYLEEGELPRGKKAVTSKWVFTIKYKSNGDIERYKARLVARGFTQTYGEDYRDTFAPVAKLHTVRVVLSLATNLEWELWQMDVKNAFLQGELEEEVYMKPPSGLEDHNAPGKVFKLKKAIYGLKQSPRAWYHKLSTTLLDRGFKKSEADNTLFTLPSKEGIVVILVYVDDIIISGNDKVGIQETKAFLKSVFDIKDLGELKYFLGIEVCRSKEGLFLSQRKYTLDLLSQVGKLGAKPAKTPLEDDYKANRKGELDNKPFEDVTQYRRLVGKLIYLTITRPDICFAVNVVSQHMQAPTLHHWNMVTRILKYLKGAPGQGIWMGCNKNTELVGYCDADYAGDTKDRRSTTGYCTFIGGNLVTWRSKKQKVVSLSSAEAEYRAMRKLTTEIMWLKALLKDFGIDTPKPITMHCDNQAAIHIASNSVFHERTKHIEVDCHKVREQVQLGVILPCYTESEEQLADIFTKGASTKVCSVRTDTTHDRGTGCKALGRGREDILADGPTRVAGFVLAASVGLSTSIKPWRFRTVWISRTVQGRYRRGLLYDASHKSPHTLFSETLFANLLLLLKSLPFDSQNLVYHGEHQDSCSVTLKGGNYLLWARTMKTILCGRGFWPHIIKSEAPRETTTNGRWLGDRLVDEDKWFQEDQMVLSVLQNSLEASILEGYSYMKCALKSKRRQGSLGLFGSKGELVSGNSSELASANRGNFNTNRGKAPWCDHCKRSGHAKEKCWILHPHLKPARREPRANQATGGEPWRPRASRNIKSSLGRKWSRNDGFLRPYSLKPLIVDSGASHHMISDSKLMKNIEPALGNVIIANGDKIPVKGLGDLELFSKKSKAFYMPTFTSNLLSVKKATTDLNCYAIFGPNDVHFQDIETSRVLGHGGTKDGLYVLEDTKLSTPLASHFSSVLVYANNAIWHARLGHPHSRALGLLLPSISFKNDECEACILGEQRNKLEPKSVKGMFIGYSITQKGYKCYIPETKKVLVSRDVKFVESKGYYEDKNWEDIQDLTHSPSDRANNLRIILERLGVKEEHLQEEENIQENILEEGEIPSDHEEETILSEEEHLSTSDHNEGSTSQEAPTALRRSERLKFPPSNWKNTRVYYNSQAVAHPIQAVCTIAHFPEEHQVFLGQIDQHWIPQTYEEAIQHQVWRDAIAAERQAMEHNHTWEEGELPRGKKAVTSKWVFTIKYKSNGDIERYKARLVARGFTQTYGEDYRDTFAPVAKLHTVRVVLSLATNLEWELWQMDVKNAFLQGELEEEVYMKPPPGLEDHNAPGKVFKLKKAIYGLKQSPRAWYHKLSTTLLDRGFKKSEADNTLFTLPSKEVSQHMQAPTLHHWNMVTRILKYLKGAPGQGIWMGCNKNTELVGYCDADYAGDTKDRRSTTGYCTFIGGNLVTWRSKKQKVVSLSSAEAEYRAMRKLTTELMWLKALLKDLESIHQSQSPCIATIKPPFTSHPIQYSMKERSTLKWIAIKFENKFNLE